jgi:predicted dithiol-disulfide oxidoreductase (DUF899 family)
MQQQLEKTIGQLEQELLEAKKRLKEARRAQGGQEVADYEFLDSNGKTVRLSELFGDKNDLIVVHNMGERCSYCTLWADGLNGVAGHLVRRCAFVVASPDSPEKQRTFAESRGWTFPMISVEGSPFTKDMGFEPEPGAYWPGFTTFRRGDDGKITRVASATFGPGDDFCPTWHLFDLLEDGDAGWEPSNSYSPILR